ncbi:MAG TPA: hypothetical protein VFD73_04320, partial [Gemmatimonadales bacterium]|nr:hypothetical protein [Gemmatimonadales bacterium]
EKPRYHGRHSMYLHQEPRWCRAGKLQYPEALRGWSPRVQQSQYPSGQEQVSAGQLRRSERTP